MSNVRRWLATAMLAVAFARVSYGADTTITVNVKNSFDKPVENAEVILDFLGSHQVTKLGKRRSTHWELRTNQDGVAHFPPVPQGTIRVQIVSKKYQTYGEKFDIDTEEKTIDVKLKQPQPQYSAHPPLKQ